MTALYVEIDPYAAEWLRNLIFADLIAPGDVDERSLEDIAPAELSRYTQVHLCAGIGVWSYALRRAGWSDDRPVWTASFPCQPFSQAGKGLGVADERHLWPAGLWLIQQCRPDVLLGEQVASKDGLAWFDVVSSDLEGEGYTVGSVDLCVAGFGGPHIRQRNFFVGLHDTPGPRRDGPVGGSEGEARDEARLRLPSERGGAGGLSDGQGDGRSRRQDDGDEGRRERASGPDGAAGGLPHISSGGRERFRFEPAHGVPVPNEPTRGFWSGADWIWFRDGKYRPVEAGTFPLAHGAPNRVGRLRAYGNALCAEVAEGFISEVMALL